MTQKTRILLLLRQPPYATGHALEAIDVALVGSAFDQEVSVLFEGAGVWQLLSGQDGTALGIRTQSEVLAALPQYGVCGIYACQESLAATGLTPGDMAIPVTLLSRAEQRTLLAAQDAVVND